MSRGRQTLDSHQKAAEKIRDAALEQTCQATTVVLAYTTSLLGVGVVPRPLGTEENQNKAAGRGPRHALVSGLAFPPRSRYEQQSLPKIYLSCLGGWVSLRVVRRTGRERERFERSQPYEKNAPSVCCFWSSPRPHQDFKAACRVKISLDMTQ